MNLSAGQHLVGHGTARQPSRPTRAMRVAPVEALAGKRYIAGFRLPGNFFGFADKAATADAIEAVSDATVIRYPRRAFENALEVDTHASRHFSGLVRHELREAQDRLPMLGRKSAIELMAAILLAMTDREALEAIGDARAEARAWRPLTLINAGRAPPVLAWPQSRTEQPEPQPEGDGR